MKKIIYIILAIALYVPPVFAATYYVCQTDQGDGSAWDSCESVANFNSGTFGALDSDTVYLIGTISSQVVIPDGGADEGTRVTIRGDYAGHAGTISGVGGSGAAIETNSQDYITIEDVIVTSNTSSGIYIGSSTGITIDSCTVTYNDYGITVENSYTWIVNNNTVSNNDKSGLLSYGNPSGPGIIRYNTFDSNGDLYHATYCNPANTGANWYHAVYIDIYNTGETQIYGNYLTNTYCGHGLKIKDDADIWGNWIEGNANYNVFLIELGGEVSTQKLHHNIIIEPESNGTQWQTGVRFFQEGAAQATLYIYNNTIYHSYTDSEEGIGIASGESGGTPQNVYIKNNIIYNAGSDGYNYCIAGYSAVGTTEIDGNLCYSGHTNKYVFDGTSYTSLGDWQTAGYDTNGDYGDALFNNAGSDEFWLQLGSPAIDTGLNLGVAYDDALNPNSSWPSSVNTLDQDDYGAGWEIGAYVYESGEEPAIIKKIMNYFRRLRGDNGITQDNQAAHQNALAQVQEHLAQRP